MSKQNKIRYCCTATINGHSKRFVSGQIWAARARASEFAAQFWNESDPFDNEGELVVNDGKTERTYPLLRMTPGYDDRITKRVSIGI